MSNEIFHLAIYAKSKSDVPIEICNLGSHKVNTYDLDQMMEESSTTPSCVLCFSTRGEISPDEIAQALRMSMPETPLFFIALEPAEFEKKRLIKNGFTNAFLLPWEKTELARAMQEEMLYTKNPEMRDYRPIQVIDLYAGTELGFNTKIFLPMNNKFVTFGREGESISAEKIEKLNERKQKNVLFVHKDEMTKFREYTVESFKTAGRAGLSATEKEANLKNGIRALVSDMFIQDNQSNTFGQSSSLLKELQQVVLSLVDEQCPGILSKLDQMMNQESDFYGHLSRVSTYATLFAMGLNMDNPAEVGLAGMLHDIGLTALPPSVMAVTPEQLSPETRASYDQHPQLSLDIIKLKRMVVSERVQKAIVQHHERLDGQGTPHRLVERKISKEAQVVALANAFDDLTTFLPNRPPMKPIEAFNHLIEINGKDPVHMGIDVKLIRNLRDLYGLPHKDE